MAQEQGGGAIKKETAEKIGQTNKKVNSSFTSSGIKWEMYTGDFNAINPQFGCYEYVYHLAKQVTKHFPGTVIFVGAKGHSKMTVAGTVSDHWLKQAVDISGLGSNGGYLKIAKALVGHPYLKYCIADNQWNKRNDSNFESYKYGGHMNHIHISFKSPKECAAISGGSYTGGAVESGTGEASISAGDDTGSAIEKVFSQGVKFALLLMVFIIMVLFFMKAFPAVGETASNLVPAAKGLNVAKKLMK